MFTGLIEELGTVKGIRSQSGGMRLSIAGKNVLDGMKAGDSIAVNGACLTVVEMSHSVFGADVSKETLAKTTLGRLRVGDRVNLERAMRPTDRLGGHLVAGHVDAVGVIRTIERTGEASLFTFEAPPEVSRYLIYKGSIAIDGISLTVNEVQGERFSVTIIPHTARQTTLGLKKAGDPVNLETDLIGKYVEKFVKTA
ncbi:MAG: riboflavin synthase [Nitrospirota bacterium]|nr:riboflavin synthase [Nitrospirota bacterium]